MNKIVESIVKETVAEDYERFLLRSSNGRQIDPNEVYLISKKGVEKETLALITSSIKVPKDSFFIDIINEKLVSSYDLLNSPEWDKNFRMLSEETQERTVTINEIKQIISKIDNKRSYEIFISLLEDYVKCIIGGYYSKGYIENYLDCKTRVLFKLIDENNLQQNRVLTEISRLFNMKINSIKELRNIIKNDKNKNLEEMLKEYGMKVLFYTSRDTEKDYIIKKLIIDYFLSDNILRSEKYFGMEYSVYSNKGVLETNIIKQLELILGKEILALTLTKGIDYLAEQLDIKCSEKGLGNSIINSIVSVVTSHCEIDRLTDENNLSINIRKKLDIMVSANSSNSKDESMLESIDMLNIRLNELKSSDKEFECIELFTDEEIRLMKSYINQFDCMQFTLIDEETYTYKDKITYMINKQLERLEEEHDRFCMELENLNRTIVYSAVPGYVSKNKKNVDLNLIIKLGTYRLNNKSYGLENKHRTKKIRKRINKEVTTK